MDLEQLESLRGCNMAIEAVLSRDPSLQGIGMSPLFHPLASAGRNLGDDPARDWIFGSEHSRGRDVRVPTVPAYRRRGATPAVRQSVSACVQLSTDDEVFCKSLPSLY
jgi:hypothetical protein